MNVFQNTDFTIEQQKLAFNMLINETNSLYYNIIKKINIKIKNKEIINCLYCNKKITINYFCSLLCKDIYYNLYENIYNIDKINKKIKLLPINIFKEKSEIINILNIINYDNILKMDYLILNNSIIKIIIYNKDKNKVSYDIKIHEYNNKISNHCFCLFCEKYINKKKKFIKTIKNTYIGPLCNYTCKYSFAKIISNRINLFSSYSFYLSDYKLIKNIDLNFLLKFNNKIINGYNNYIIDENNDINLSLIFLTY